MIRLEEVSKSYGEKRVLSGLSLELSRAAFHCIAGPSGSGKTTLFRLMMGLERLDSGNISGIDINEISAVFQEDRLCESLSAGANIRLVMPTDTDKSLPEELLAALGLPGALHTPVREMSGGMQRRVALARALAAKSEVYLFDEAFTGLDYNTRAAAIDVVSARLAGKTLIMITHDESEAEMLGAKIIRL